MKLNWQFILDGYIILTVICSLIALAVLVGGGPYVLNYVKGLERISIGQIILAFFALPTIILVGMFLIRFRIPKFPKFKRRMTEAEMEAYFLQLQEKSKEQ